MTLVMQVTTLIKRLNKECNINKGHTLAEWKEIMMIDDYEGIPEEIVDEAIERFRIQCN